MTRGHSDYCLFLASLPLKALPLCDFIFSVTPSPRTYCSDVAMEESEPECLLTSGPRAGKWPMSSCVHTTAISSSHEWCRQSRHRTCESRPPSGHGG